MCISLSLVYIYIHTHRAHSYTHIAISTFASIFVAWRIYIDRSSCYIARKSSACMNVDIHVHTRYTCTFLFPLYSFSVLHITPTCISRRQYPGKSQLRKCSTPMTAAMNEVAGALSLSCGGVLVPRKFKTPPPWKKQGDFTTPRLRAYNP